jgi:uncharacterized membrane protein YeaQ/YmgE (transglycosylase-associated protein family)
LDSAYFLLLSFGFLLVFFSSSSFHPQPPKKEHPMHILWSLIVGLVVGAIAKAIMPGRDPGGIVITMLLGVAGAVVAGFIGRSLGWYTNGASGPGIIASVIGAIILLAGYRMIARRRTV